MHRSIVTGATGFLGSALCAELLTAGDAVTAVIRPGSPKKEKLLSYLKAQGAPTGRLQILELELGKLLGLWEGHQLKADTFYHLAWNGSSGEARNDYDIQLTNIAYLADAIRAAKSCGCRRLVGAGSQAEYGVVKETAYEDATLPHPFMMYGAAKLAAFEMGRILAAQEGIEFVWPRIYSVYGVGENPGTLVNYVIGCLQDGTEPQLSACGNMWNFIYISDCVRALRLLGSKEKEAASGIVHIASEDTRPLKQFVEEIREVVNPKANICYGAKKTDASRTFWLQPDTGRLREMGFVAQVAFADGIRRKIGQA